MEHPEMRNTAFGAVLAELLEKRGLKVTPYHVGKISEEAGPLGDEVLGRMVSADALRDVGDRPPRGSLAWGLGGLDEVLDLSEPEKDELGFALAFEQRKGELAQGT
jgi:hypothetical protein